MVELKRALELLGFSEIPSGKELKTAFRRAVLDAHPDRHSDNPRAGERLQEIFQARQTLAPLVDDPLAPFEALLEIGAFQECLLRIQGYLGKHPGDSGARVIYSAAFFGLKDYSSSARQALRVIKKTPSAEAYAILSLSYQALGLDDKAVRARNYACELGGEEGKRILGNLGEDPSPSMGRGWLPVLFAAGSGLMLGGPFGAAVGLACGLAFAKPRKPLEK